MPAILVMYLLLIPCAAAFIRAKRNDDKALALIFKVASTTTILLTSIFFTWGSTGNAAAYAAFVTAGLALGLAGDVAICEKFIAGMLFFALGHFSYIAAVLRITTHLFRAVPVFIVLALLIFVLYQKNKRKMDFGKLMLPALIYCVIILSMVSLATTAALSGFPGGVVLFAGAVLFAASDTMLALNQFHDNFNCNCVHADRFNYRAEEGSSFYQKMDAVSLSCYYIGQSLFAVSVFLS